MKRFSAMLLMLALLALCACSARPANLPPDFPPGAMPYISGIAYQADRYEFEINAETGGGHMLLIFTTSRDYDETVSFYEKRLESYFSYEKQEVGGMGMIYSYDYENYFVDMLLMPRTDAPGTSIVVELWEHVL